jgi:hypothetical protein
VGPQELDPHMSSNAKRRGNEARASTPAPLRGHHADAHAAAWQAVPLLRLPRGEPEGHDTCPVRSIAAAEVEGLVLGQVRRLIASPELVARMITAVRRRTAQLRTPNSRRAMSSRPSERSSRCGTSCIRPSRLVSCGS